MTNKDIFQTIGASKENFRMTEAESQDIKAALMAHMKANPVKQQSSFFASLMRPMRMAVSALSVVLVAGVGVSYAAEASLPGDLLYPVKVNVVEEVRASLTFNAEAKANYEVKRTEKRITEAVELAEKGELNAEVEAKVLQSIQLQSQKVNELVVELETKQKSEASVKVQNDWNKVLVDNEAIVVKIMEPKVATTEPEEVPAPVIEALPAIEITPSVEIEIEPVVEPVVEPTIEIEVTPSVEVLPEVEVTPSVEIEIEPVVEPVIEPTVEVEITPSVEVLPEVEVTPSIELEIEPVVEPVVEPIPSPVLIDSGLLFESRTQLQLNPSL